MRLFALLLAAVLLFAFEVHASSIIDPTGPGPWTPQPELQAWYDTWMVFQNGTWHIKYTPATKFQCLSELRQIKDAYPPVAGVTPGPGPEFVRRFVFYHPAWREASSILDWHWTIPRAN